MTGSSGSGLVNNGRITPTELMAELAWLWYILCDRQGILEAQYVKLTNRRFVVRLTRTILTACLLGMLVSCAGGRREHPPVAPLPGEGVTPPVISQGASHETTLDEALAELEALATPEGVDDARFSQLKSALANQLRTLNGERGTSKLVSTPPTGEANRVEDLTLTDNGDGTYTLTWSYVNVGDYNQDSVVNIIDISSLAAHFHEEAVPANEWIDGFKDGLIDIKDITPLAANFFVELADYLVEGASNEEGPYSPIAILPFSECTGRDVGRGRFAYDLTPEDNSFFRVVPRDGSETAGEPSATVALPPKVLSVSPIAIVAGEPAQLSAQVLGASPLTYHWSFGNGVSPQDSTDEMPEVMISEEGSYESSLTLSSPYGEHVFEFSLSAGFPPEIISVTSPDGKPGEERVASAEVTGTPPFAYEWHFGGGATPNTSGDESPTVTLGGESEYGCSLTVSNPYGSDTNEFILIVTLKVWHLETVDGDGEVGTDTSVAFDQAGNPAIAYYDITNGDLKLSLWNGSSWAIETVDSAGDVGWFTSLAFDDSDNPVLAYYDITNADLKIAWWGGAAWDIGIVDSEGDVGAGASLTFNSVSVPAISYYDDTNGTLKYATWNGVDWDTQSVAPGGTAGAHGWISRWTSLAFGLADAPAIAFYDEVVDSPADLMYAYLQGDTWTVEPIAPDVSNPYYPGLAFDALGNAVVTYIHTLTVYVARRTGPSSWDSETIPIIADAAYNSSIAADTDGNAYIVTYGALLDGTFHLGLTRQRGSEWEAQVVDNEADVVGQFPSLVVGPSDSIGIGYYDWTNKTLKFAWYY